jgi:hypothetical protein
MEIGDRTIPVGYVWALGLLLATVGSDLSAALWAWATLLGGLGVALGIAYALVAAATVALSDEMLYGGRRMARNGSIWFFGFLVAVVAVFVGLSAVQVHDHADLNAVYFLAFLFIIIGGPLALAAVIAAVVAVIAGLSSAAKARQWGWFWGMLVYLVGSSAGAGWVVPGKLWILFGAFAPSNIPGWLPTWVPIVLMCSPLLIPPILLIYVFFTREKSAH